ncbi:hypothetical protein EDD11_009721 [Mortierella claussenii]|nr:hypothetical protein EDD11_009721 [Mortierella claussenii]
MPAIYQNQATAPILGSNSGLGTGSGNIGTMNGQEGDTTRDANINSGGTGSGSGGGSGSGIYHGQNASTFQNAYQPAQDFFSSFQGHRGQPQQQQQQQHPYQQQQQQQSPLRQTPSYSSSSSLSSSLPAQSGGLQQYSQQQRHRQQVTPSQQQLQDQSYRSPQHQQQQPSVQYTQQDNSSLTHPSLQSNSSASSFPRDTRLRSRSQSLTTTLTGPSTSSAAGFGSLSLPSSGITVSNAGGTKKVIIPARPRTIPPRPPQSSAPRKYHGRQMRKVPMSSLDHQQISGVRELVPPTRRLAHIQSEQKRREKINTGFDELKSVIPECAQNTDSKATILRKAVDRILELEDELRKYTDDFHYVPEDSEEYEE